MNKVEINELRLNFFDRLSEANNNYEVLKNTQSEAGSIFCIIGLLLFTSSLISILANINYLFFVIPVAVLIYFLINKFSSLDEKVEPLEKIHSNNVEQLKNDLIGLYSSTIDNLPETTSNILLLGKLKQKVESLIDELEEHYEPEEDMEDIFYIINKYSISYKNIVSLESKV